MSRVWPYTHEKVSRSDMLVGTSYLLDDASRPAIPQNLNANDVKYDKSNTIILVPQPTDDPNDPLVPCKRSFVWRSKS